MATYKEIFGKKIQALSADPPAAQGEGQIWYNDTTNAFKTATPTAAWASGPALSTARAGGGSGGIPTSAWLAGGVTSFPASTSTATENFNGSSWTGSGALTNARVYAGGAGPQTAGIIVAGATPFAPSPGGGQTTVESYNGEAWSAETATPIGLWSNTVFGTAAACTTAGANPQTTNFVFDYDGSSWTTGGTMNAIRAYMTSAGTQTAGGVMGGLSSPPGTNYEQYDGSSWTAGPALNTARYYGGAGGPQTATIYFGGETPAPAAAGETELFDGTSWTEGADLATARSLLGSASSITSNTAALAFGGSPIGDPSPIHTATEEYTNVAVVKTITAS